MTDEMFGLGTSASKEPQADSATTHGCKRPGCEELFEPRAHSQRYCSLRCKRWVSNHSPAHLAAKERYDDRRRESGLKAEQDARWYANGGWYKQLRAQLRRRLAAKLELLSQLTGQDLEQLKLHYATYSNQPLDLSGLEWGGASTRDHQAEPTRREPTRRGEVHSKQDAAVGPVWGGVSAHDPRSTDAGSNDDHVRRIPTLTASQ